MKKTYAIILSLVILILVGCKSTKISELNKQINIANKESIKKSPFKSANSMGTELKVQIKLRDSYIKKIEELKVEYPDKPILLTESYSYVCLGCVADYVNIFVDGVLINFNFDWTNKKYIEKTEYKKVSDLIYSNGTYDDIKELYENLNKDTNWNENPTKYGNEDCFDGDQTFYTVFYPNSGIESMYMRCWVPTKFRTK